MARAKMIDLFPRGFEELEHSDGIELAAYTDAAGEERLWHAFGGASASDVEPGWEDRWRTFHHPIRIGRLWVGPPWETPDAEAIPVVIDPGRAFGTGGHMTTRLCLELLLDLEPASLLDVGCGSGVLSIAAAKLGFAPIVAVDVEPQAIEATSANAVANGVEIDARLVDALEDELPPAAVAVANVTLPVAEAVAPRVGASVLVTSGYLVSDRPALAAYEHVRRVARDGWAADVFAHTTR